MIGLSTILGELLAIDLRALPRLIEAARIELESQAGGELPKVPPEPTVALHSADGPVAADQSGQMPPGSLVAVVPLFNVVTRHGYWGAAGTLQMGRLLQSLDADPAVGSIILSVNSPGGSVYGTAELANVVRGIRERGATKTAAVADPLMASAATWIATAAEKVYAIESADVGSIGVLNSYADYSAYLEKVGIKVDVLRTPDKKARFTGVEPLTDAMRETMQSRIEEAYQAFVGAMAKNRRTSAEHVVAKFGGGEVMGAAAAVEAGLIDGIASLDEIVSAHVDMARAAVQSRRRAMAYDAAERRLAIAKAMM